MKHLATTCLAFFLLLSVGCSSSKDAAKDAAMEMASPLLGSWGMEGASASAVQFMSSGDVMLEQGDVLTAINRHQNTNRSKYISRLVKEASYEMNDAGQLVLNVMADWTGKGTGARKAEDKSVASSIVFAVQEMGDMVKLTKVNMTQSGSGTDNTNSDEDLSFTLKKM